MIEHGELTGHPAPGRGPEMGGDQSASALFHAQEYVISNHRRQGAAKAAVAP